MTRHDTGLSKAVLRSLPAGALLLAFTQLVGCGGQLVAWPPEDVVAPTVISTAPERGAFGVMLNRTVTATFSEALDPDTITSTSFVVFDGATPVPGAVSYAGITATFDPNADLATGTVYTAIIRQTAADPAGNTLAADYSWTFTTGGSLDVQRPVVTLTIPADDATGVAPDASVVAVFSEAMDPLTFVGATFTLHEGANTILGSVMLTGATATFNPDATLAFGAEYTAIITTAAADLAGNTLATRYEWSFTVADAVVLVPPRVTLTDPVDLDVGVPRDTTISAAFSQPMTPLTAMNSLSVTDPAGMSVPGTLAYDMLTQTVTFVPTGLLEALTEYTAVVAVSATNLAGTPLATRYPWTFTTGPALPIAPRVILTNPEAFEVGVPLLSTVSAAFNQPMDPLTPVGSFTLTDEGGMTVPGLGAYDVLTQTLTFTPTNPLLADTTYTATVSTDATNMVGTPLAMDFTWDFTTPVVMAPRVIITSPVDLDTGVLRDAIITATFSEPMNAVTAQSSFSVLDPDGNLVVGALTFDVPSQTLVFVPDDFLRADATYTATVTTDATSLLGTPLAADYPWEFTTGIQAAGMLPVNLGSLTTFVAAAGAGLTNSNSSGMTTLGGDVALSPTGTCLGDGLVCTALNPLITGTLFGPGLIAATAKVDLLAAYVDATSRPPGTLVNDISGMVLQPGVYTSASTMSIAVDGTVTLDGNGDPNAVFIFQVGSSLTVNNNAQVILINGARARNVFWAIFASSTLGSNVSFQGSVLAGASNSVGTDSSVVGRLLCTTGQITLLSNTITLPL
jgi:hypothetical protein